MVESLKLPTVPIPELTVRMANGNKMPCNMAVQSLKWWTQGHTFDTAAKVLPLSCYDMILGMDWLEIHSPMWVHWKRKQLRFSHQGKRITLRGVKDNLTHCHRVTGKKLKGLIRKGSVAQIVQLCSATSDHRNSQVCGNNSGQQF